MFDGYWTTPDDDPRHVYHNVLVALDEQGGLNTGEPSLWAHHFDRLGIKAGDRVLQYVSRFLKRHIREADYIFRWGGDEFLVLITCEADEAARKAAVLKTSFDAAPEAVELPPGIGLSVGWAEVPPGTEDLLPLVREADERMYADKGSGREAAVRAEPAPAGERPRGRGKK